MDEHSFLTEINSLPWQPNTTEDYRNALLVLADWLEERGDPRAELIQLREWLLQAPTTQQRQNWEPRLQTLLHQGVQATVGTWETSFGMKFCWCPPGDFIMGSPFAEHDLYEDETQVPVTLSQGFWMGTYPVTQGEWEWVMESNPWSDKTHRREGEHYPATYIHWEDANAFCRRATEEEQQKRRLPVGWEFALPTEAQWEYACRAGTTTAYCCGNDIEILQAFAWITDYVETIKEAHPRLVGQKRVNAWGLHDVHGNVWEWCRDGYTETRAGGLNPFVSQPDHTRAARGGSWLNDFDCCRAANRSSYPFETCYRSLGFRAAIVPQ